MLITELKASLLREGKTLNRDSKEHQVLAAIQFAEMQIDIYENELIMDQLYMKRNKILDKSVAAYNKFVEANSKEILTWEEQLKQFQKIA